MGGISATKERTELKLKYLQHATSWEKVREGQQAGCRIVGCWGCRYICLYFRQRSVLRRLCFQMD